MPQVQESSVAFNLASLMELEQQRVAAEVERSKRAEREAAEQAQATRRARQVVEAQAEAARREAAHEQDRQRAEDAARFERERAVAMERVRVEVEERELTERQRVTLAHAREVQRMRLEAAPRVAAHWLTTLLLLTVVGVGALHVSVFAPALRIARDQAMKANAALVAQAKSVAALRDELARAAQERSSPSVSAADASPRSSTGPQDAPPVVQVTHSVVRQAPRTTTASLHRRDHAGVSRASTGRSHDSDLGDLETGGDPILGMFDSPTKRER